jgi:GNAT superfamily N-acetyltransferase
VTRLVLDPRYRGAGIASRFLRTVCRAAPWPWIELASEMANLVPFCEAAGFRRAGRAADKTRSRSGRLRNRLGAMTAQAFSAANTTSGALRRYRSRVRFSRPAYYILDNRQNCRRLTGEAAEASPPTDVQALQ